MTVLSKRVAGRHLSVMRDLVAMVLLWVLVVAFFWKIAVAGRVMAGGDVFTYFYPYWAEATRALRAGRLPLWNPYLFMGVPFLANSQAGVFYPLNWPLWLLFPAHRSIHLTVVLHSMLAAANTYVWGRVSLRMGRVAAWTAGAVLALGGYLGAQMEHVNQVQGLAWLPLLLMLFDVSTDRSGACRALSVSIGELDSPGSMWPRDAVTGERSARTLIRNWAVCRFSGSRVAFVALAVVVSMVLLAGHTQTAFIALVGLAVYGLGPALWRLREREWVAFVGRAAVLGGAVGLGLAVASVQLIPTWELSRLSIRAGGLPFRDRFSFSLSPFYLTRAMLPRWGDSVPPEHLEHVAYVGIAGLGLLVLAARDLSARRQAGQPAPGSLASAALLGACGLFLSLGLYNPVYLLLARYLPGFAHFRVPARWLACYAVGMSALVGWGVESILRSRTTLGWRGVITLALAVLASMGWAVVGVRVGEGAAVGRVTVAAWGASLVGVLLLFLVTSRSPRAGLAGFLVLLVVELFAGSITLPHARATAAQAFTSLRPALSHMVAIREATATPSRFISMSDTTFDPGDLPEIQVIFGPQLSTDALYDYVVASKMKEVLAPNVPLAFRVQAADGYDGGVLPLARFVEFQELFLQDQEISIDGRLRENLSAIPDGRWLSLMNVRSIITDKLRDAWLDDVFYDLQFGAELARDELTEVTRVPRFEATSLGLVTHLRGGAGLRDSTEVGVVELGFDDALTRTFALLAGEHTVERLYGPDALHEQALVGGRFWPGQPQGSDYVTRLRWSVPATPVSIVIRATLPTGKLVVRGASLIDDRTGGFQALVISNRGRMHLVHSGDVKIYENLEALPRAYLVHRAVPAHSDEAALALMKAETFEPGEQLVLHTAQGEALLGAENPLLASVGLGIASESARVTSYAPESVEIEVHAAAPGYVVLTDAWYPGWEATVDGKPVELHRANLLFRAVWVTAGSHRVIFTYRPVSVVAGGVASLVGLIALVAFGAARTRCPKMSQML